MNVPINTKKPPEFIIAIAEKKYGFKRENPLLPRQIVKIMVDEALAGSNQDKRLIANALSTNRNAIDLAIKDYYRISDIIYNEMVTASIL